MTLPPYERVLSYFANDARPLAIRALRSYYAPHQHWTGSAFDQLIDTSSPHAFTSTDFLAVSMLSVNVPPRAALQLLDNEEVSALLKQIPPDASLWAYPHLLDRDAHAWRLWDIVDKQPDVGTTIASKILAVKRPMLIPIYDQHVATALDFGTKYWAFWQAVVSSGQSSLRELIDAVGAEAGIPASIPTPRIVDVVVWMRQHGWKQHKPRWNNAKPVYCTQRCDFAGFGADS